MSHDTRYLLLPDSTDNGAIDINNICSTVLGVRVGQVALNSDMERRIMAIMYYTVWMLFEESPSNSHKQAGWISFHNWETAALLMMLIVSSIHDVAQ